MNERGRRRANRSPETRELTSTPKLYTNIYMNLVHFNYFPPINYISIIRYIDPMVKRRISDLYNVLPNYYHQRIEAFRNEEAYRSGSD